MLARPRAISVARNNFPWHRATHRARAGSASLGGRRRRIALTEISGQVWYSPRKRSNVNDSFKAFAGTARSLARNPLGIIALFIVLVYGFACLLTGFSGSFGPGERLPLIYFLVVFPVLVLAVFAWLVSSHSNKLFAPSDFKDEANYVQLSLQLRHAVQEANVTVDQLRRLIRPIVMFSVAQMTYSNRLGGMPDREQFREALVGVATELGLAQDRAFQAALGDFFRHEIWDRYQKFISHVRLQDQRVEMSDSLNALSSRDTVDFPTRSAIEKLIGSDPLSPEARRLLLDDYVEYAETKGKMANVTAG
jgi:hypothetical protein